MKRYLPAILITGLLSFSVASAQLSDSLYLKLPDSIKPKDRNHLSGMEMCRLLQGASYLFPVRQFSQELNQIAAYLSAQTDRDVNKQNRINNLLAIADYYYVLPEGSIAYHYYRRVIDEAGTNKKFSHSAGLAYRQIGGYFSYDGRQDSAIQNLHKALSVFKESNDSAGILATLTGYSLIYYGLELFQKAISYNNEFLEYAGKDKKWGSEYTSNYLKNSLYYSKLYSKTSNESYADSARETIETVMSANKADSVSWYGTCYFFLGYLHFCRKQYSDALYYFDLSLNDSFRINDKYLRDPVTKYFFRALSLIKTGDYPQGKRMLDGIAVTTFSNHRWKNLILYEYAKSIGDWKSAYQYHKEFARYTDSMNLVSLNGIVFDVEQKYSLAEKQAQINHLENLNLLKEKEQNRLATIIIFFGLGLGMIVVILYGLYRRSQQRRINDQQKLTAELYRMEENINEEREAQQAHRQVMINEQKKMIAADINNEIAEGLASLQRRFFYNRMQTESTELKNVLQNLEEDAGLLHIQAKDFLHRLHMAVPVEGRYNVVNLLRQLSQRFRDDKLLQVTYECEEQIVNKVFSDATNHELYLVIREAIANIIKHADATKVNVQISFASDNCMVDITDNGRGFDKSGACPGMGLSSIEKRIKSLQGIFQINSGYHGTSLKARFPVA